MVEIQTKLKAILKKKYQWLIDTNAEGKFPILHTDLYVQPNKVDDVSQHEFRKIEDTKWNLSPKPALDKLQTADIFDCESKSKHYKTLLTVGVSGSGKSTHVHRRILDWAEGKSNQDVQFVFPLSFWELNLLRKKRLSLTGLLYIVFPELEKPGIPNLENYKVWFVLDGLNDCRLTLDFRKTKKVTDVEQLSSVSCLLANLIQKDTLLPCAHVWITSRQATASRIPTDYIGKVTEILGFSDSQRDKFFNMAIKDKQLAEKVVVRLKTVKRLNVFCQLPLISSVCAWVFTKNLPKAECDCVLDFTMANLTRIYVSLFYAPTMSQQDQETALKLEKLALKHLEKGNMIFFEEDLKEHSIAPSAASQFAKSNPLIMREVEAIDQSTSFHFTHPSMLEFLAASGVTRSLERPSDSSAVNPLDVKLKTNFFKKTVEKALGCRNGQLDVFLRFVMGLSDDLMTVSDERIKERMEYSSAVVEHVKEKLLDNPTSDRCLNLLYCLSDLHSDMLRNQVMYYLTSRRTPVSTRYSTVEWAFLAYLVLSMAGGQETFHLDVSTASDVAVIGCLPAIASSRKACLRFCNLTDSCCKPLSTILSSDTSYLRELDLGYNNITEEGLWHLNKGIKDPKCRLEKLGLAGSKITGEGWGVLSLVLRSSRYLREVDISGNDLGQLGLHSLSDQLIRPNNPLRSLNLSFCKVSARACYQLAAVLDSFGENLKELDLSINNLEDDGLSTVLRSLNGTRLVRLELCHCKLTERACSQLGAFLQGIPSLEVLNLSYNDLKDAGIRNLCRAIVKPNCLIETLNLSCCGITKVGCETLASALDTNPKYLKNLDLSRNNLGDDGIDHLAPVLKSPSSRLEILRLSECDLTEKCCASLCSALVKVPSTLRELDLCQNKLQDQGVKVLCDGLSLPVCKLEILLLRSCSLTTLSFTYLRESIKANPSHLTELHLMGNSFKDVAVSILTCFKKDRSFKMNALDIEAEVEDSGGEAAPVCCAFATERKSQRKLKI